MCGTALSGLDGCQTRQRSVKGGPADPYGDGAAINLTRETLEMPTPPSVPSAVGREGSMPALAIHRKAKSATSSAEGVVRVGHRSAGSKSRASGSPRRQTLP